SVPIPGEPCRSEDELKAPSRLMDDFLLELTFAPPVQTEEDALREFMRWLKDIPIVSGASTNLEEFPAAGRTWHPVVASPPLAPPAISSPPSDLHIDPFDADHYTGEALRIWVTELRPKWFGRACGCAPSDNPKGLE